MIIMNVGDCLNIELLNFHTFKLFQQLLIHLTNYDFNIYSPWLFLLHLKYPVTYNVITYMSAAYQNSLNMCCS